MKLGKKQSPPKDYVACELYYLADGILRNLGVRELGQGEDGFVIDLYQFAEVLANVSVEDPPGVFSYEVSNDIAARLYLKLWDEGRLNEWETELQKAVDLWSGVTETNTNDVWRAAVEELLTELDVIKNKYTNLVTSGVNNLN